MATAKETADEMLTRLSRTDAHASARNIVNSRGGVGRTARFWAEVAAHVNMGEEGVTAPADESDPFSFSQSIKDDHHG